MNKAYLIFPLIGLLIFGGFYYNFSKGYEAKIAALKAKEEADKKEKTRIEIENREKAIQAAIEAQARRKKEREEKERIEEAKRVARQEAEDKRERAFSDYKKFNDQVSRLKRDLAEVQEEIKKIEDEKKALVSEQAFLKDYVKQAESNVKYYYELLDKIAQAEKAREAAAAAAAAAKKS
ncbi:MAG: hypothetical protein ACOZE5_04335 [Verrucomicrobiota bacterium]